MSKHQQALVAFSPNLEQLLDEDIGYGKGQYKVVLPVALLAICQGAQTIAIGLLLPILKQYWHLSTMQEAIGLTVINLGFPLGSFLQSFSDNYGRKTFIYIQAIILIIFGLLSTFSWNFQIFVITRFFCEIGMGMILPLAGTYTSEIAPSCQRATLLAHIWIVWCLGDMLSTILGYFFLINHQWRIMLLILCIPCILALIIHIFIGRQTLHYLWVRKQTTQVYKVSNEMCQLNNKPPLSLEYIQSQIEQDHFQQNIQQIPISALFSPKYKSITIKLIIIWLANYFIYYAIALIFPTIITQMFKTSTTNPKFEYIYLFGLAVVQVFSNWGSPYIMNHISIGRKRGLIYGLAIICVCAILSTIFNHISSTVVFGLVAVVQAVNTVTFAIIYIYTAELYETLLRSKAEGVLALAGRLSVALLGIVGLPATKWLNGNGLYVIFIIFSLAGTIASYKMPYCTSNKDA